MGEENQIVTKSVKMPNELEKQIEAEAKKSDSDFSKTVRRFVKRGLKAKYFADERIASEPTSAVCQKLIEKIYKNLRILSVANIDLTPCFTEKLGKPYFDKWEQPHYILMESQQDLIYLHYLDYFFWGIDVRGNPLVLLETLDKWITPIVEVHHIKEAERREKKRQIWASGDQNKF